MVNEMTSPPVNAFWSQTVQREARGEVAVSQLLGPRSPSQPVATPVREVQAQAAADAVSQVPAHAINQVPVAAAGVGGIPTGLCRPCSDSPEMADPTALAVGGNLKT